MKLAQRVINLAESATLAVSSQAAKLRSEGVDVIGFGAGEPDFDTPDHIKQAAITAIQEGQTKYAKPASGLPATREAICAKFSRQNSLTYKPDEVMVTSGGKMAIFLLAHAVLDPGDEVVIPKPYWVSYPEIVKLAGAVPVFPVGLEENDYKLSPEILAASISDKTRMVILNSPSNPSGVTYHPDELKALAAVLQDRDLIVISDEIYDQLLYRGQQTMSYAAINDKTYAQTVTLNAASKTYSMTGWRLGYAGGPIEIIKAMKKLQTQSTSGAATFNQVALAAALIEQQSAVETMRLAFEQRGQHMHSRLSSLTGVRCSKPTGAFYCFPNVSGTYSQLGVSGSIEFSSKLLEQVGVAVVPGVAFGMDEHVRFSFATSMENIDEGLNRFQKFVSA